MGAMEGTLEIGLEMIGIETIRLARLLPDLPLPLPLPLPLLPLLPLLLEKPIAVRKLLTQRGQLVAHSE